MQMPEGGKKEKEIRNVFLKIIKDKFLNLVKEKDIQVREAQRVPNKMNAKRTTLRHIIIKMSKINMKRES